MKTVALIGDVTDHYKAKELMDDFASQTNSVGPDHFAGIVEQAVFPDVLVFDIESIQCKIHV